MITDISSKGYFNERGQKYVGLNSILNCYKDKFDADNYYKYLAVIKGLDWKEKNVIRKAIFFDKTKTTEEYFDELEDKTIVIPERKPKKEIKYNKVDITYPNLLNTYKKNLILYNDKNRICGKAYKVKVNKKGEFVIIHRIYSNKLFFFSSVQNNYYKPLERLNTSLASKSFLILNMLAWILESFGYICKDLYILHSRYKEKNTYRVPYIPKLIYNLIKDFNHNKRDYAR